MKILKPDIRQVKILASAKKRLFSRLFDLTLIIIVSSLICIVLFVFKEQLNLNWKALFWLSNFSFFLIFFLFLVCIPYFFQKTLGQYFFSLKLVTLEKKSKIIFWKLFLRELFYIFTPILITFTFFFIFKELNNFLIYLTDNNTDKLSDDLFKLLGKISFFVFFSWWLFIYLFHKFNEYHQIFIDRYLNFIMIDLKIIPNDFQKNNKITAMNNTNLKSNQNDFLTKLNEEQKDAAFQNKSVNLRILAGPGTGKTTVLTERIAYLISKEKLSSEKILALTFTRKACNNIRSRLELILDKKISQKINIFTYHGFGYWFLNQEKELANLEDITISVMDRLDQNKLIRKVINLLDNKDFIIDNQLIKDFLEIINLFQENMIYSQKDFVNSHLKDNDYFNKSEKYQIFFFNVYDEYRKEKKESNLFDYVDLLTTTYQLLKNNPFILSKWQNKFDYIAIDEFQDTNKLQYQIITLLSDFGKAIPTTVVGDPDQTIYGWRGAEISYILDFDSNFLKPKTITLKKNYRSGENIVELANHLISFNHNRVEKELVSANNDKSDTILLARKYNRYQQSEFIVNQIRKLLESKKASPSEIVILYRANYLSVFLEKELLQNNFKYHIIKGQEFFQRREVKEFLNLLALVATKKDLFVSTILEWAPKIGKKTIEKLQKGAKETNLNFFDYIMKTNFNEEVEAFKEKVWKPIYNLTENLDSLQSLNSLASDLFENIYREILSGYPDYHKRIQNIQILINNLMIEFERKHSDLTLLKKINQFLLFTKISAFHKNDKEVNMLQLMTIHNAKGLEFKYVFVFDVSSDNFPKESRENIDYEEERRLFFVAITRAKKGVYITTNDDFASLFIDEIEDYHKLEKI